MVLDGVSMGIVYVRGMLDTVDLAIVIVYCLGMVLLGVWFSYQQRDAKVYLLGDKNVAWWLVLISIVATETSTVTFLSVTGKGFGSWDAASNRYVPGNLTFLQLALGYIIGRCLIAWWLVPQYFRGELYSAYQVLRLRFGPVVQKVASVVFMLTRMVADGLRLYLAGLFLSGCMNLHIDIAILAMGIITLVYTYLGGIKAILWTDLIQFCIKVGGALVALLVIWKALPGGSGQYFEAMNEGQSKLFEFTFDWTVAQNFWAGLFGGAFLTMASHGADQMMVQRYLCSRNLSEARLALISSGFVIFFQFLLFLLVGIGFYVLMTQNLFAIPSGTHPDKVFALFLASDFMPVGVRGLIIAAVIAAAMSTLSASWNAAASTVVYDFYQPWRPTRSEAHYLNTARIVTLLAGILQITIAWLAVRLIANQSIVDKVLGVAGLTTGLLLGLFMLGTGSKSVRSRSALLGMLTGLVVVNILYWGRFDGKAIAWPWYTPAGALTTWLVGKLVDRFSTHKD
jgi:solute:Na+ symporter, SSS family